jgi:DNA-binding SARP family transcriptional activator/Tfp pilus assembly protein PilF
MDGQVTYHQQISYCGKPRCRKCREGKGHGPYWYAYQIVDGRTVRTYIGKELPADIKKLVAQEPPSTDLDHAQAALRIYTLGQLRLERRSGQAWQAITDATWQHQRVRAPLICLLTSPGRRLGREQVMDALWPDLDIETATGNLNRAVHSLRHLFEPGLSRPATSQLLLTEREQVILADQSRIWIDADAFEELINQAHAASDPEQAEHLLMQADQLYAGDFLQNEGDATSAIARRDSLQRKWRGLLLSLADLRIARKALSSTVDLLDRLLVSDPVNEAAVQRLMLVLTHLDRRGEALRAYQLFAAALKKEYDIGPTTETRALYEAVRRGDHPAILSSAPPVSPARPAIPVQGPITHPAPSIGRSGQSPLVGRDHELEILHQLLLATAQHLHTQSTGRKRASDRPSEMPRHPQCILLLGEVGIGKTRLAEELGREAQQRGWSVAWSRVYAQESNAPYRLWTEALRKIMAQSPGLRQELNKRPFIYHPLRTLLPELHELLPQVDLAAPLPPEQEQLRLWEATRELLTNISESAPLLVVLDDLQWSDGSSGELFGYLARRLHGYPILLVGTCRDTELPSNHPLRPLITDLQREQAVEVLRVHPLTEEEIRTLVSPLPDTLVQHIQAQAAGNPFFAEELARVSSAGSQAVPALPDTINAVLDLRLGRLTRSCQRLLGSAAVLGGSFEFHLLRSMEAGGAGADEDAMLDLLDEALKAGMLTEEGVGTRVTYHFWHPLLVNHLYDTISAARRASLHRRTANVLCQVYAQRESEWAAAITHHLVQGGADAQHIARYAELAGDHAYALSAYPEAERHYRLALDNLGTPAGDVFEERLHLAYLLERLAECAWVLGNIEETRRLYKRILKENLYQQPTVSPAEALQEAQLQAILWAEIGWTWYLVHDYIQARRCLEHGEQVLQKEGVTGGPVWARLLLQQSFIYWLEGDYSQARDRAQQSLELLEEALARRSGPVENIHRLARTRRTLAGDPGDLGRAYALLGAIADTVGQPTEALANMNKALTLYEQYDRQREIAHVCCNIGDVHLRKAEHSEAQAFLRRSLSLAEKIGDAPLMAIIFSNLGLLAVRLGNLVEAEDRYRRSIELAEQVSDQVYMSLWYAELSTVLQDQGKLLEALNIVGRALMISRTMKNAPCSSLALVALGKARIAQAIATDKDYASASNRLLVRARTALQRALTLEGLEAVTRTEGQLGLAQVSLLLGEPDMAQQQATQALEEARQHELTWLVARCQRLLGEVLSVQGQHTQADEYFQQAMQIFRKCGMRLEYARTLHSYGAALLRQGPPGEASYLQGLGYVQEARQVFSECGAAVDLKAAGRLLATQKRAGVADHS